MQKSKKQLLGALGLGIVTAITAVAIAIPSPDANATNSGDVNIKVEVHSQTPSLVIQSPSDGADFTNPQISISNNYSKVSTVQYKLTYIAPNGARTDYNLPDFTASTSGLANGIHNWTLNLNNYGGQYGQYVLETSSGAASDYVSFTYKSSKIEPVSPLPTDPVTGDPIIKVSYSDDVCSLRFQAYNKVTNVALFNPEFVYQIPTPRPAVNIAEVALPFAQYNAEAGNYRVVVQAYGCGANQDDPIGDPSEIEVPYTPPHDPIIKNEDGDPTIGIRYDFPVEVCVIKFQATNKATGAAVFHPEFEHPVTPPSKRGIIRVTLPFAEKGAESGDYLITATFYDCSGGQLGSTNYDFDGYVKPVVPGVPDTGGGFFAGLNFSRKDYLVTGLVVFVLALVLAVRFMAKNRKSNRR